MIDLFPPHVTMYWVDLLIITACILATVLVFRKFSALRRYRAHWGAVLAISGVWALTLVYIADLTAMVFLPGMLSEAEAHEFMQQLHLNFSFYSSTVAVGLISAGLVIMTTRVLSEAAQHAEVLERLELHQANLDQASELANVGYYVFNSVDDEIEFCTETHARNHGLTVEEYKAQATTLHNEMPLIHPDDRATVHEGYRRVQDGETVSLAYRALAPDGERQIREIVQPIFDEQGQVVRELGSTIDISSHFETERQLFLSQKNEAIGQLTGGVAHDFNNLLAVILGNLELLEEDLRESSADPEIWESGLTATLSATNRGAELVRSLLSFAQKANLEPEALNWNKLIVETQTWLRRTLNANIDLKVELSDGLWSSTLDRAAAQSSLVNMVLNAQKAMVEGGTLTIETANVTITDEMQLDQADPVPPGRYAMVAVSDTGVGIAAEDLGRVFDPFFTTRAPGEGSGLGLAMVHGFMRQSGGTIRVYSEPGQGTTFKLYFPAEARVADAPRLVPKPAAPCEKQRPLRILLAEDLSEVSDLFKRVLRQAGHKVTAAPSGDAALAIFEADRGFDLVITDIVMPGSLQGASFANAVRAIRPRVPVIFVSGYAKEAAMHGNGLRPDDVRLMKPVSKSDLLNAVAEAVAKKPQPV